MSQRRPSLSRAQLLGGVLATGGLAACGGATSVSSGSGTVAPACTAGTPLLGAGQIFSDPAFKNVDTQTLTNLFDHSSKIDATHQGYYALAGQQVQTESVIRQIPSGGIVIQTPGTYRLGNDVVWTPASVQSSAIQIQCSNVTLDLSGFTLTAAASDLSQQITGVLATGPAANPTISNIVVTNGTIANFPEYGVLAKSVCGIAISRLTVTGICMKNLNVRFMTPAGIMVSGSQDVSVSSCQITQLEVTTDSSAGIMLFETIKGNVTGCVVNGMVNNDGAIQAFSLIKCLNVTTTGCTATTLQSHFNGNVLTSGHTVLGFCPIFCSNLSYVNCSASGLVGCCDDCHAMSVFLDANVTVSGFRGSNVVDGMSPENMGAKATGLEVFGVNVTINDCVVSNIKAINPEDLQSTGFSAWGLGIQFNRCQASNVTVVDNFGAGSHGTGFGWAPDPRAIFCYFPALSVTYTDCTADHCDVAFDTWYHVNSTWTRPAFTNCTTGFLVQPGGKRTLTGNPCSECNPPISVTITNIASGNTFPQ